MTYCDSKFIGLTADEEKNVNGGLVGGILAGGVLGLCAGAIVGTVALIVTAPTDTEKAGKVMWKTCVTFTTVGMAIGGSTPV